MFKIIFWTSTLPLVASFNSWMRECYIANLLGTASDVSIPLELLAELAQAVQLEKHPKQHDELREMQGHIYANLDIMRQKLGITNPKYNIIGGVLKYLRTELKILDQW